MSLHCLDSGGTPAVAGPPERLELHEAGTMPPWPAAAASRAEIKIVNLASEPIKGSHASLDLGMLKARARGRVDLSSLHLSSNGKSVPLVTLADRLLFPLSVPPRTVETAYLDFTPSTVTEAPQSFRHPVVDSLFNLVRNPGFEQGDGMPEGWNNTGSSASEGVTLGLDAPRRPNWANTACACTCRIPPRPHGADGTRMFRCGPARLPGGRRAEMRGREDGRRSHPRPFPSGERRIMSPGRHDQRRSGHAATRPTGRWCPARSLLPPTPPRFRFT